MLDAKMMVKTTLPQIAFGSHTLSRLILGANTINGGSHLSRFVDLQMKRYFTLERIFDLLRQCEAAGINAWQADAANLEMFRQYRAAGGALQFISLAHPGEGERIADTLVAAGAIGIAHHGEVTDTLFKRGEIDKIQGFLKRIRESGVMVGVSTHMPEVVDYVESKGWDVDFYMTCVYKRPRTREELKALLGHVPIRIREVYLEEDPPRMFAAMRQTKRACLAFKILAAGRLCERQETVEEAFRTTLTHIKPNDAIIVGLYPEHEDQVGLDAEYVRRYG